MALVTTGEAATGSTAAEGTDMLSSLATLSMHPALPRPTELPGGQPPGSADGRFVRQANLHLSDAEGLSQLVATARDVPLSEWEDLCHHCAGGCRQRRASRISGAGVSYEYGRRLVV